MTSTLRHSPSYASSRRKQLGKFVTFIVLLIIAIPVVHTQGGYPSRTDVYITDDAGIVSAEDAVNIRQQLSDLKAGRGIEMVVVTINSIHDYNTGDATIESFATHLFNTWRIGDRNRNDGALILVALKDRKARIELGGGYDSSYNAEAQAIIDKYMLPDFRSGAYSAGISQGVKALVAMLSGQPAPDDAAQPAARLAGLVWPILALGGLLGVLVAGGFGLRFYTRYHPRRCPNCQQPMIRLDEVSDDVYLDSKQKVEEVLRSVNYDVWKCPSCGMHTLHAYYPFWSVLKRCPQCKYLTLKTHTVTVREPTHEAGGRQEVVTKCRHCDYHRREWVSFPTLSQSSSLHTHSGGSFGGWSSGGGSSGGSSSGGGASGSW